MTDDIEWQHPGTCGTCRHYRQGMVEQTRELKMLCKRHPPQVLAVAAPQGIALITTWPYIASPDESCGDYQPDQVQLS